MAPDERTPALPYAGESYHGQPALKASHWDWTVSTYIFLAGLSGGAQALAAIARGVGGRRFGGALRTARIGSVLGTAAGAGLLIKDLRTPQRWYNMLRILRPTSPMSFGSYILGAFGTLSGLTAAAELPLRGRTRRRLRRAGRAAQTGAAVAGAGAATYTAALLSATSAPFWAATPAAMGVKFATSSVAIGAAALALVERLSGRNRTAAPFEDIAALATGGHLVASLVAERQRAARGLGAMARSPEVRRLKSADLVLAGALPLAAFGAARLAGRSPALGLAGSAAVLVGGFAVRHLTMKAGQASAENPEAHLALAQARNLPRIAAGTALPARRP